MKITTKLGDYFVYETFTIDGTTQFLAEPLDYEGEDIKCSLISIKDVIGFEPMYPEEIIDEGLQEMLSHPESLVDGNELRFVVYDYQKKEYLKLSVNGVDPIKWVKSISEATKNTEEFANMNMRIMEDNFSKSFLKVIEIN
jgi:hypothetical protein